ncbi:MAG: hypothetical protein JO072_12290 [Parafilimonas sp.]|nr:hypothetical protein [Parafilimonas sp.]
MTKEEVKQVSRLFKKLLILLVLLFVFDRLIGTWLQHAYQNAPQGDIKTFAHSITDPAEDIFIYGSSRAVHGYDPEIFADSLGLSCFNSGRENSNILYHSAILKEMLKKHTPKVIVLDVSAKELTWRSAENSKFVLASMILPYVHSDTSFQNIAKQLFPDELRKAEVSKIYAYNSLVLPLVVGKRKLKHGKNLHGYVPLRGNKVEGKLPSFTDDNDKTDPLTKQNFEDFVKTVKANNIRLYVVQSPLLVKQFNTTISLDTIKSILNRYNEPFWDYGFDTAFTKKQLFYDNLHLNTTGATLFTEKLVSDIKADIEKNQPALLNHQQSAK